mgnify:CR=1 FL=1
MTTLALAHGTLAGGALTGLAISTVAAIINYSPHSLCSLSIAVLSSVICTGLIFEVYETVVSVKVVLEIAPLTAIYFTRHQPAVLFKN